MVDLPSADGGMTPAPSVGHSGPRGKTLGRGAALFTQHFPLVLGQASAPTNGRSHTAPVTLADQAVFRPAAGPTPRAKAEAASGLP